MARKRIKMAAGAAVLLGALLPTLALAQMATSLTVADQTAQSGATSIVVEKASYAQPFYIVVHEGSATQFGPVVGNSPLMQPGEYTNVVVPLQRAVAGGEYLWPMLHTENNGNGVYDDAATDKPIADAAAGNAAFGGVMTFPLQVTVQASPAPAAAGNAGLAGTGRGTSAGVVLAVLALGLGLAGSVVYARRMSR